MWLAKTYEAIVKGQNIPKPGIPESFKVLIKELQSLGLDMKVLDKNNEEIDLRQNFDDEDDIPLPKSRLTDDDFAFDGTEVKQDSDFESNYQIEEVEDSDVFSEDDAFSLDNDDSFDEDDM